MQPGTHGACWWWMTIWMLPSLTKLLRMHGHEARSAHDGLQALALERELQPHTLLLDISLPRLSGHALAR